MSAAAPRFSVIITAYNRRQFLPEAIRSALAQTVPPSEREILVVTNFEDTAADALVRENGLRSMRLDVPEPSPKLWAALAETKGELVALLDDDDVWEPDKLRIAAEYFSQHPRLGYFAHRQSLIDESGLPPPPGYRGNPEWERSQRFRGPLYHARESDSPDALARLREANPGNNSSLVVRRDLLLAVGEYLREVRFSIDSFLFYAALLSPYDLAFDGRRLTRLRQHGINMSHLPGVSYRDYFHGYHTMMDRFTASHAVMLRMATAARRSDVEALIRHDFHKFDHFRTVATGDRRRGEMIRLLLQDLGGADGVPQHLVVSESLYVVSPALARVSNYLWGQRRWRR